MLAAFGSAVLIGPSQTASACSCAASTVARKIASSATVYIAEARSFDLLPGKSFRVVRTLRGPLRSNLRVKVIGGDDCGTVTVTSQWVLTGEADGRIHSVSACSDYMKGTAAVAEAQRLLGEGRAVARRVDWSYTGPWIGVVTAFALAAPFAWRRGVRRREGEPQGASRFAFEGRPPDEG